MVRLPFTVTPHSQPCVDRRLGSNVRGTYWSPTYCILSPDSEISAYEKMNLENANVGSGFQLSAHGVEGPSFSVPFPQRNSEDFDRIVNRWTQADRKHHGDNTISSGYQSLLRSRRLSAPYIIQEASGGFSGF